MHDLGKGTTPENEWPKHIAHEERGVPLVKDLCTRLKVPNHFRDLAVIVTRYHLHYHRAAELRPETMLKTLLAIDAFRRPDRFEEFLLACEADSRGRTGYEDKDFDQPRLMRDALQAANGVDIKAITEQGFTGEKLANEIKRQRSEAIAQLRA